MSENSSQPDPEKSIFEQITGEKPLYQRDGHAERVANTISRDPEQGTWPAEAEAQRQVADADTVITVRMEETCTFSLKFTVAKLAEHLGVAPTLKEVTEALDGANEDISPGDALVDVMEDGYDACTDRTITHEVEA